MPRSNAATTACLLALSACAAPTEPEPVGKSAEELTAQTVQAVAAVGQVAASLAPLTESEPAPAEGERPAPDGPPPAPSCAHLSWNVLQPLRVGVTFVDCPTASAELLNGTATAWLAYDGVDGQVGVQLDAITVGDERIDGFLVLASDGPSAIRIDTDVRYQDAATRTDLQLALSARVSTAGDVVQLDGSASLRDGTDRWTADADALRWEDRASCVPTSGVLDIGTPTLPPIEVVFMPTSMTVTVGGFPVPPPAVTCE